MGESPQDGFLLHYFLDEHRSHLFVHSFVAKIATVRDAARRAARLPSQNNQNSARFLYKQNASLSLDW